MTEIDYALLGIDAVTILRVWSFGFGSVFGAWCLGFSVGVAVDVIKKA